MAAAELDEDARFSPDEVSTLIQECIENMIGRTSYSNATSRSWCEKIADACILNLNKLEKPYKYALTCKIMQRNGAGVHSASSCYWDSSTDAVSTVHWENDTIHCIVTVFGFAL